MRQRHLHVAASLPRENAEQDTRRVYEFVRRDPKRTAAYYAEKLALPVERVEHILEELVRLGEMATNEGPTPKATH